MLEELIYALKNNNINFKLETDDTEHYLFFPEISREGFYMYCYCEKNQLKLHKRIGMNGYNYNLGSVIVSDKQIEFIIDMYFNMKRLLE